MRILSLCFLLYHVVVLGQTWEVKRHPNNGKMAIIKEGQQISSYRFTEVSELSEGMCYVAEGDSYGYLNVHGKLQTPYQFVIADNFTAGFARVGDSLNQNILNAQMRLILPNVYKHVRLPKHGLIVVESHEGLWGAYDVDGRLKLPVVYTLPPIIISKQIIIVQQDDSYGVVDCNNKTVYNTSYQYISANGYGYKSGTCLRLFTN